MELALLNEKSVPAIANDLGISDSCLRNWIAEIDIRRPMPAPSLGAGSAWTSVDGLAANAWRATHSASFRDMEYETSTSLRGLIVDAEP